MSEHETIILAVTAILVALLCFGQQAGDRALAREAAKVCAAAGKSPQGFEQVANMVPTLMMPITFLLATVVHWLSGPVFPLLLIPAITIFSSHIVFSFGSIRRAMLIELGASNTPGERATTPIGTDKIQ